MNIKILVNSLVAQSDLTEKQRNHLLGLMTDQVGELVLKHNYYQNRAITMIERHSVKALNDVQWLIEILEKKGHLNRVSEGIPETDELKQRSGKGQGLVRPEIAVLLAYSKQLLKQQLLLELSVLDKNLFQQELMQYFPLQLQQQFPGEIKKHYLAQEIVANGLVNSFINRMGMVLAFRLMDEVGCTIVSVFNVYKQVCNVFVINTLWQEIESQCLHFEANVLDALQSEIRTIIERSMHWFLSQELTEVDVQKYINGIAELKSSLSSFISEEGGQQIDKRVNDYIKKGVPSGVAVDVVSLDVMYLCLDVIWLNQQTNSALKECAQIFFALMGELDLLWLRDKIRALPEKTVWESLARRTAREEFNAVCCSLSLAVLQQTGGAMSDKVTVWAAASSVAMTRYRKLLSLVHADNEIELEKITVLLKELRDLCANRSHPPLKKEG